MLDSHESAVRCVILHLDTPYFVVLGFIFPFSFFFFLYQLLSFSFGLRATKQVAEMVVFCPINSCAVSWL